MTVKFGGLDMAMRVDNSALIVLKLEDGVLEQVGQKVWPHISLDKVNILYSYTYTLLICFLFQV